ncbi:MAG: AraC family transcriptional regulator [Pseudomonadota bacterium]
MVETLDVVLRTSTATLLILYAGLAIRDGWQHKVVRYSVLAVITLSALFLSFPNFPLWVQVPLRLMDACNIAFIWWASLAMFDEDFRLKPIHWLGLLAYTGFVMPYRFLYFGWIDGLPDWMRHATDIVTLSLVAHLIWKIVSGLDEDLVNRRRRVRIIFVSFVIAAILISVIGENILQAQGYGQYSVTITALATLPVVAGLIFWVTRLQPETLLFQTVQIPEPKSLSIDPRDSAAHKRLMDMMEHERAWTEPGLTIGSLSEKVGLPEHQLRNLINRGMGHRNFASFLNGYRLTYAKSVLSNPEQARLPVLTIAMDAGFGSLAPFNRAFKAAEGITPTAFRAKALADQS